MFRNLYHNFWFKITAVFLAHLIFINSAAPADINTPALHPGSLFTNCRTRSEAQALLIFEIVKERALGWPGGKTLDNIYLDDVSLWKRTIEPAEGDCEFTRDECGIRIGLPKSDYCIRISDSSLRDNAFLWGKNWHEIEKKDIHEIKIQLLREVKALPAPPAAIPDGESYTKTAKHVNTGTPHGTDVNTDPPENIPSKLEDSPEKPLRNSEPAISRTAITLRQISDFFEKHPLFMLFTSVIAGASGFVLVGFIKTPNIHPLTTTTWFYASVCVWVFLVFMPLMGSYKTRSGRMRDVYKEAYETWNLLKWREKGSHKKIMAVFTAIVLLATLGTFWVFSYISVAIALTFAAFDFGVTQFLSYFYLHEKEGWDLKLAALAGTASSLAALIYLEWRANPEVLNNPGWIALALLIGILWAFPTFLVRKIFSDVYKSKAGENDFYSKYEAEKLLKYLPMVIVGFRHSVCVPALMVIGGFVAGSSLFTLEGTDISLLLTISIMFIAGFLSGTQWFFNRKIVRKVNECDLSSIMPLLASIALFAALIEMLLGKSPFSNPYSFIPTITVILSGYACSLGIIFRKQKSPADTLMSNLVRLNGKIYTIGRNKKTYRLSARWAPIDSWVETRTIEGRVDSKYMVKLGFDDIDEKRERVARLGVVKVSDNRIRAVAGYAEKEYRKKGAFPVLMGLLGENATPGTEIEGQIANIETLVYFIKRGVVQDYINTKLDEGRQREIWQVVEKADRAIEKYGTLDYLDIEKGKSTKENEFDFYEFHIFLRALQDALDGGVRISEDIIGRAPIIKPFSKTGWGNYRLQAGAQHIKGSDVIDTYLAFIGVKREGVIIGRGNGYKPVEALHRIESNTLPEGARSLTISPSPDAVGNNVSKNEYANAPSPDNKPEKNKITRDSRTAENGELSLVDLYKNFISENIPLFLTLLEKHNEPVLLSVPVEIIGDKDSARYLFEA
ncbi:MAG: DMT family transporter, partial [Candidatus Omnitrophica bacterium]|nr:DMT family transporter [Candidatus Omnitrophota bacterium]